MVDNSQEIRAVYRWFSSDNGAYLPWENFGTALRVLGCAPSEQQLRCIRESLKECGADGVSMEELVRFFNRLIKTDWWAMFEPMRACLSLMDSDGSGFVTATRLRVALTTIGEALTVAQVDTLVAQLVDDQDMVNIDDFLFEILS